jgi:hypothetical protein
MIDPNLQAYWDTICTAFTITDSTNAKIIVDKSPPQVVASVSGETALPGESAVRQRILQGGCQIIDGTISSSDATLRYLNLFIGKELTLGANMGTVAYTATTNATITRTVGSYITEGWKVGMKLMGFNSTNSSNDGKPVSVTAVTATTLTLNGVSAISVAGTQDANLRLFAIAQRTEIAIAASAGTNGSSAPVKLIGNGQDASTFPGIQLGEKNVLIGSMAAAVSALPASVDLAVTAGYY